MKVRHKIYSGIIDVYAIYWSQDKRHYYFIPYHGYEGLQVTTEDDCELVDDSLDNFEIYRTNSGDDIMLHKAIKKGVLLDQLIDCDPDAMVQFLENLKSYQN